MWNAINSLFIVTIITTGRIMVDGINIAHLPLAEVRRRFAIIPQDPVLFTGTIRCIYVNNIPGEILKGFLALENKSTK